MKVLIVIHNLLIAGAQKMVEQLSLSLHKQNVDFLLVCLSENANTAIDKRLKNEGIEVVYLNKKKGFHLSTVCKLSKIIDSYKPTVIHTHMGSWMYVVLKANQKHIPIIQTIHSQPKRQESHKIIYKTVCSLYKKEKMHPVAISNIIKSEAIDRYQLPQEKIEMIVNPVDYDSFSNIIKENHIGTNFVTVARFDAIKNHSFLLKTFALLLKEHQNAKLILAGDGPLLAESKELARTLNIQEHVEFLGNVENVPLLFQKCDALVLPSLSEGLPISILEAESAGLPIIASNVGGIPDIVKENGILFEVNNEKELLLAMKSLCENEEKSALFGVKSKEIAKEYSADNVAKKYIEVYKKYSNG